MSKATRFASDQSMNPPRLDIQQSWWAMIGLGNGEREWTLEEKFEKIAEAGFTGIMGRLPEGPDADLWRRLLDDYRFSFGIHSFPGRPEDITELLKAAKQFGVQYVNSQVIDSFVIGEPAIELLNGLVQAGRAAQMPYFVETHRGRVTQDLHRTVDYVKAIPDLRLTIDLSHYIVAGEVTGNDESVLNRVSELFESLLERTSSIHARVSNGEQVQVDIGPDGEHPMVGHYMNWWQRGIGYWLKDAQPGDLLPFVPELGPPDYAITNRTYLSNGRTEISDRWEQALVLKRLGEEAWKLAVQASGK